MPPHALGDHTTRDARRCRRWRALAGLIVASLPLVSIAQAAPADPGSGAPAAAKVVAEFGLDVRARRGGSTLPDLETLIGRMKRKKGEAEQRDLLIEYYDAAGRSRYGAFELPMPKATVLDLPHPDEPSLMPGGVPDLVPGERPVITAATERPQVVDGFPDFKEWDKLVGQASSEQAARDAVVRLLYASSARVCTGILIHARWVLTAAHCVEEAPSHIGVGPLFRRQTTYRVDSCQVLPDAITRNERCGVVTPGRQIPPAYDLALLRLSAPIPTHLARPARVLLDAAQVSLVGLRGRAVGYGTTVYHSNDPGLVSPPEVRQQGPVEIKGIDRLLFGPKEVGTLRLESLSDAFVSAGDSGGPVFVSPDSDGEVLVGVNVRSGQTTGRASAVALGTRYPSAWIVRSLEAERAVVGPGGRLIFFTIPTPDPPAEVCDLKACLHQGKGCAACLKNPPAPSRPALNRGVRR